MKKAYFATVLFITLFLLSSCGKKTVQHPDEVIAGGKLLKYSDTREKVEDMFGKGELQEGGLKDLYKYSNALYLYFSEEDEIRLIQLEDDNFKTYKNIHVGDDIDKVEDAFDCNIDNPRMYAVYFDGDEVIEPDSNNQIGSSDWFSISYYFDEDGKIFRISLMDREFATLLR